MAVTDLSDTWQGWPRPVLIRERIGSAEACDELVHRWVEVVLVGDLDELARQVQRLGDEMEVRPPGGRTALFLRVG